MSASRKRKAASGDGDSQRKKSRLNSQAPKSESKDGQALTPPAPDAAAAADLVSPPSNPRRKSLSLNGSALSALAASPRVDAQDGLNALRSPTRGEKSLAAAAAQQAQPSASKPKSLKAELAALASQAPARSQSVGAGAASSADTSTQAPGAGAGAGSQALGNGTGAGSGSGSAAATAKAAPIKSLAGFKFERVLNQDNRGKRLVVLGSFAGESKAKSKEAAPQAIVIFERSDFEARHFPRLFSLESKLSVVLQNDIYHQYSAQLSNQLSKVKVDVIYPCTEKHVAKHTTPDNYFLLRETPELYKDVHEPYIASIPAKSLSWVHNLVEKKAEAERLLLEDADESVGFVLHPDTKWDLKEVRALYCLATVRRRDLRSLRDLTAKEIPLLENIRTKVCAELRRRFGVPAHQLRLYLHYAPSYYHLHVHCVHTNFVDAPGTHAGRAHLLDDVIENLVLDGRYYQRRTLPVSLPATHELAVKLIAAGAAGESGDGSSGSGSGSSS